MHSTPKVSNMHIQYAHIYAIFLHAESMLAHSLKNLHAWPTAICDIKLGRTHEKQWIRRSESTSAKREWIWIYESTAFEYVLRLNTPQANRHFYDLVSCSWYILDEIVFNNYICIIKIETLPLFPSYITYQLYKYILWTWVNLSYYINTFINHYCIRLYNYIHLYTYDACIYSHGRNY